MKRRIEVVLLPELEAMHTGSLMNRRNALLGCEESMEVSDKDLPDDESSIEFKNSAQWQKAYNDVKRVLATRENIMSKFERKNYGKKMLNTSERIAIEMVVMLLKHKKKFEADIAKSGQRRLNWC